MAPGIAGTSAMNRPSSSRSTSISSRIVQVTCTELSLNQPRPSDASLGCYVRRKAHVLSIA
jgi:hypothetical protein